MTTEKFIRLLFETGATCPSLFDDATVYAECTCPACAEKRATMPYAGQHYYFNIATVVVHDHIGGPYYPPYGPRD